MHGRVVVGWWEAAGRLAAICPDQTGHSQATCRSRPGWRSCTIPRSTIHDVASGFWREDEVTRYLAPHRNGLPSQVPAGLLFRGFPGRKVRTQAAYMSLFSAHQDPPAPNPAPQLASPPTTHSLSLGVKPTLTARFCTQNPTSPSPVSCEHGSPTRVHGPLPVVFSAAQKSQKILTTQPERTCQSLPPLAGRALIRSSTSRWNPNWGLGRRMCPPCLTGFPR